MELPKLSPMLLVILLGPLVACEEPTTGKKQPIVEAPKYLCGARTVDISWYQEDNVAPLIPGLDAIDFPITTKDTLAQRYFNQGMCLAYGFNHAEAARSFHYASKLDPECAMAHWGFAYVLGPNYNAGMEDDNYERAYAAVQRAQKLANKATEKEQALIDAMSKRYLAEPPEDRSELDKAYSAAMKALHKNYPDDPDIGAMYAESLMDQHPWDLFTRDGQAKEWTPEIIAVIEQAMADHPMHPGAHHLYIHAVEASNTPERGLASAKLFDDGLVPGSGHLVHMPSHIYIRTGDYHMGTVSNINAVEVDSNYLEACHAQGAYPLGYYPHNIHFMAATATLEGNSKWAIYAANELSDRTDKEVMTEPGWETLQHYYTTPYNVYVKFGLWDEILTMPQEPENLIYPTAVRHYARGIAFVSKGDLDAAKQELAALEVHSKDPVLKEMTIWELNTMHDLIQIAKLVLQGEIQAEEGNHDEGVELLKQAVAIEDALNYNEPPDWFFSVRHRLGNVQLEAGMAEEAIATLQEDLEEFPKNGWALNGLRWAHQVLEQEDKVTEIEGKLRTIWATADVSLDGPVIN